MYLRHAKATFLLMMSIILCGCVSTSLTSDVDPNTQLDELDSFVVVKQSGDGRGIENLIATSLTDRGKEVSVASSRPDSMDADAVVLYEDKWMWDITMYMLELTIQIRNPQTDYLLATGKSYRTSLARKSPEFMVSEVVAKMFDEPNDE